MSAWLTMVAAELALEQFWRDASGPPDDWPGELAEWEAACEKQQMVREDKE